MTKKTDNQETHQNDAAMTPPEEQDTQKSGRKWWRHAVGIGATFVIVAAIFIMLPVMPSNNPKDAMRSAWSALQERDISAFKNAVNLESLVQSVMEQVVVYEEALHGRDNTTAKDIRQAMRSGVIGAFHHDLSRTYSQQILSLVKTGSLPENSQGLLAKIWAETGAQKENFLGMELIDQHESSALAALRFIRPELGNQHLSLNLLLERSPLSAQQGWAITGIPNLASYLLEIENLRRALLQKINLPIRAELDKAITFMDVQKSAGLDNDNPGVLWRIAYLNSSGEEIADFKINMEIYNAEGVLLREETFQEADALPAGAAAEKVWPMPLSPSDRREKQIIDSDLRSMRLEISVTKVTFKDGRTLAVYDKLPTDTQQQ